MLQHIAQINCNRVYYIAYIVYIRTELYSIINVKWHILLKMPLKSDFISTFLDALKSPNDSNYFSHRLSKLDYSRPVFILTLNTIRHTSKGEGAAGNDTPTSQRENVISIFLCNIRRTPFMPIFNNILQRWRCVTFGPSHITANYRVVYKIK